MASLKFKIMCRYVPMKVIFQGMNCTPHVVDIQLVVNTEQKMYHRKHTLSTKYEKKKKQT